MSSRCAPALHYKVSGIGRFRLPIPSADDSFTASHGRGSDWRIANPIRAATVRERFFWWREPSLY